MSTSPAPTESEIPVLASLVIAGCSLAVSMAAGASDRRRPCSLLRLAGVPLSALREVVALETAAPLAIIALDSAAIGQLAAALFLKSQLGISLRAPGTTFYIVVIGGIVASVAVIASTLPLLNRITRPGEARIE